MHGKTAKALLFALVAAGMVIPRAEAELRAGIARVDITPPAEGTYLRGYAARTSPSVGVFDPLYARALVLEDGEKRLALVALDLCVFRSERVAREAKERHGIDLVLMNNAHTHTGPSFARGRWDDPARCDALKSRTEDRVLEAIGKAAAEMFRARLSVAKGNITLGYHRLVMQPNGRRKPLWENRERIPIGPVDPTVGVIRVEDTEAETTRALVVNYACHPVCLGPANRHISADYVGGLTREFEKGPEPSVICLFMQGAAGDTNPSFRAPKQEYKKCWEEAMEMGGFLAKEVQRVLPNTRPVGAPDEIQWRTHEMTFGNRWNSTGTVEVAMATVMINRTIGLACIPGEPLIELQTDFTREAPVAFPLFLGYTTSGGSSEWPGYIPDIRAAAEGGYGASYTTRIEIGAGERLVNTAVADLYWMKGMFLDKPER